MNDEFNVSDYSIFDVSQKTTSIFLTNVNDFSDKINEIIEKLKVGNIFMGPACDNCLSLLNDISRNISVITEYYTKIKKQLSSISESYSKGDKAGADKLISEFQVLGTTTTTVSIGGSLSGNVISSTEIPSSIKQGPYTVTCYGVEGWWLGGTSVAPIASGSSQESVHDKWVQNGAKYKNGIAVINQDGVDYYLIATSETLGSVGDKVKVNFDDGSSIPCIIADSKSPGDSNYTDYGHSYGDSVNILEFEVDKDYYLSRGNPSTDTYGLDWNSNSNVTKVDDYGSVI